MPQQQKTDNTGLKEKNYNQEAGTAISQVLQNLLEMDLRIPVFLSMP